MRLNMALLLAKKEIKEIILRSKYILSTVIALPIFIGAVLPIILSFIFLMAINEPGSGGFFFFIPQLLPNWGLLTEAQQYFIFFVNLYSGLMNLIVPLTLPVYIAADSFAGEKERKSLEPLLASPLSDFEILMGKTLTSLLPSLLASIFSIILSVVAINLISVIYLGMLIYPVLPILVLYIFAIPLMGLMTIFTMILVSSRVQKVREASQIGGVVIIPIIGLFFTQMFGVIPFSIISSILFIIILGFIVGVLIFAGLKIFKREKLIEAT